MEDLKQLDLPLLKLAYLATQRIEQKWTTPIHNWALAFQQLIIKFKNQLELDLSTNQSENPSFPVVPPRKDRERVEQTFHSRHVTPKVIVRQRTSNKEYTCTFQLYSKHVGHSY